MPRSDVAALVALVRAMLPYVRLCDPTPEDSPTFEKDWRAKELVIRRAEAALAALSPSAPAGERTPAGDDRCGCWDRQAFHRTVGMLPGEVCVNKGGNGGLPKLRTSYERARVEGTRDLQRLPKVAGEREEGSEPTDAEVNAAIDALAERALRSVRGISGHAYGREAEVRQQVELLKRFLADPVPEPSPAPAGERGEGSEVFCGVALHGDLRLGDIYCRLPQGHEGGHRNAHLCWDRPKYAEPDPSPAPGTVDVEMRLRLAVGMLHEAVEIAERNGNEPGESATIDQWRAFIAEQLRLG